MTDAQRLDAAVFDLGGVLIDVDPERAVRVWAEATGLAPDALRERLAGKVLSDPFERGEIGPEEFRRDVEDKLGVRLPAAAFERGWAAILGGPLPGIEPLLADLERRMRLVVLTNTNAPHAALWRRTGADILEHFERVFTSHEMGYRKPDPASFQRVLDYLSLPPERVLYFDDTQVNVHAAGKLGMVARLVDGAAAVARELVAAGVSRQGRPTPEGGLPPTADFC